MTFKHEFIHAAHLNTPSLIKGYNRYSEKAAHAYSYTYGKVYGGYDISQFQRLASHAVPIGYSWKTIGKYIPLWIR